MEHKEQQFLQVVISLLFTVIIIKKQKQHVYVFIIHSIDPVVWAFIIDLKNKIKLKLYILPITGDK